MPPGSRYIDKGGLGFEAASPLMQGRLAIIKLPGRRAPGEWFQK